MRRDYFILSGLALLFFFPFLGGVHLFDWDEINFAECAREMILTGDYLLPQIDFQPFWEKPPLFFWMQALSMHVFGVNEFAARLPNAVCGWVTLLGVYSLGYRHYDRFFAWLWALAWLGSILPHLYFRSGIIDPWFNLFTFLGIYGFVQFRWQFFSQQQGASFWIRYRYLLLGGLSLGLAVMTKGPAAYLIAFLVLMVYWARYRFRNKGYAAHVVLFLLAAGSISLLWFGLEAFLRGPWFVQTFVEYQIRLFSTPDSGHGGFLGYHFIVLLIGCFPASVFAIPNLWGDRTAEDEMLESHTLACCKRSDLTTWMQILFWVVLILFSLVRTKIVHYSSLCYFPITFLSALTIWRAVHWDIKPRIAGILLPVLGVTIGLIAAAVPYLGQHIDILRPLFSRDAFALENLNAAVEWRLWEGFPGLLLAAASLGALYYWRKKQAWTAAQLLFAGSAGFIAFTLALYIRNIAGYSQLAAIEFCEQRATEGCLVQPHGYKSYAHLFYCRKKPVSQNTDACERTYFIAKITNMRELAEHPDCRELYRKNGFVFFEKK